MTHVNRAVINSFAANGNCNVMVETQQKASETEIYVQATVGIES